MIAQIKAWLLSKKKPTRPPVYVSWYKDPRSYDEMQYLKHYPAGNCCQEYWSEGYEYVSDICEATKFASFADAKAVTPSYDGSGNIEQRAGVLQVCGGS